MMLRRILSKRSPILKAALLLVAWSAPVSADIASVNAVFNATQLVFHVLYTQSSRPTNGWQFQILIDADNNPATGYSLGYDRLVRGVEFTDPTHVSFRQTLGGGGSGGWGGVVAPVRVTMVSDVKMDVEVNLASSGLPTGNVSFTFESYFQGRLVDYLSRRRATPGEGDDCNANDVSDDTDLLNGTSKDCNSNGRPDECDIAALWSRDCNANDIPDDCDIAAGTSEDCTSNAIPDECEADCNGNGIGDPCDIRDEFSLDCDLDQVPDECESPAAAVGCRYLLIHPPAGPRPVAIKVTGDPGYPLAVCLNRYVQPDGSLGTQRVVLDPLTWCSVPVTGTEILPNTAYRVSFDNGLVVTPPVTVTTWLWGDADNNRIINFADVMHILRAFKGADPVSGAIIDFAPCMPDGLTNFNDIQATLLAFQGFAYQTTRCPLPCP